MRGIPKRFFMAAGVVIIFVPLCVTLFFLLGYSGDVSAKQTEGRLVFGATYMTMNNPYYQVLDARLRSEIEAKGDVLLTRDAAMDQDRQNKEIGELIKAGAAVIFLTPVEWDTVSAGIELADRAGVPIIVVDAPVQDTGLVTCSILSDNYQAGVLCAEHLMSVRDSAEIILLEHITARSGADRIQGFRDALAGHDGFEILASGESDGQIENAMPVMEKLLEEYPNADTVMALNDPSALGALAAIQGAGLSECFLVYSVDGSPEGKTLVNDRLLTATCAQFPYEIAKEAAAQAYRAIDGGCEQHEVIIPVELLTEENVVQYGTDGWQ